jgi:hypothetical protein
MSQNMLDESDPAQADVLNAIKMRFRQETFTRENIQEVIVAHPQIVCVVIWIIYTLTNQYPDPVAVRALCRSPLPFGDKPRYSVSQATGLMIASS